MAFVFNDMPAHSFVSLSSISTPIVVADIPPARVEIKKTVFRQVFFYSVILTLHNVMLQ